MDCTGTVPATRSGLRGSAAAMQLEGLPRSQQVKLGRRAATCSQRSVSVRDPVRPLQIRRGARRDTDDRGAADRVLEDLRDLAAVLRVQTLDRIEYATLPAPEGRLGIEIGIAVENGAVGVVLRGLTVGRTLVRVDTGKPPESASRSSRGASWKPHSRYLQAREAATLLGWSVQRVAAEVRVGRIPGRKVEGRLVVDTDAVHRIAAGIQEFAS